MKSSLIAIVYLLSLNSFAMTLTSKDEGDKAIEPVVNQTVEFDSPQSETEIDSWGTLWVHETKWKGMKGVTCWFFEGQYIVDSVNTDTKLATLHLVESRNSVPTNACQINSEFEISFENFKKLIRKTNLALSRSQVGMCAIIFYLK